MTSPRVRIVQLDPAALAALAEGDLARAQLTAPVALSPWLSGPDCRRTWRYRATQVVETPEDLSWVTGVLWDDDERQAVGKAGFHGAPDADGMVEVGYAVDPAYRRRGYARAALAAMVQRATDDPTVTTLRASVSPDNDASLALLADHPFRHTGEQWDDEDGLELVYELDVSR
jgi:RimJ/RimL family protein N-acetyltransferase